VFCAAASGTALLSAPLWSPKRLPRVKPPDRPVNNITRQILVAIALLGVAVLLWRVADVLIVGFGGIVLAALLRAFAIPLTRITGWRDRWAVLVVLALAVVALSGLVWLFGHQATTQATGLLNQLPIAFNRLIQTVQRNQSGRAIVQSLQGSLSQSNILSNVGIAAGAVIGGAADVVLVLFLGIYFAIDPQMYRNGALRLLPPNQRSRVGDAMDDAAVALQKWLIGQGIAMVTVGLLVWLGLAIVGVPLPFALGLLAAVLEFVPVLGPILFSIPGLLLAFTKGPETVLYALLVYFVVQQLEGNVLIPIIQRWAVRLPPVVGVLAIVAGGLLLGVTGIVFATPLAVVAMRLVQHLYVEDTLENGHTPPPNAARRVHREAI
jgi:predicted PurR-regulated permease PerM